LKYAVWFLRVLLCCPNSNCLKISFYIIFINIGQIWYGTYFEILAVYATVLYRHGDRIDRPGNWKMYNSTLSTCIHRKYWQIFVFNQGINESITQATLKGVDGNDEEEVFGDTEHMEKGLARVSDCISQYIHTMYVF